MSFSTDSIENKWIRRLVLSLAIPFVLSILFTMVILTGFFAAAMTIRDEWNKFVLDFKTDLIPRIKNSWKNRAESDYDESIGA